MKVYRLIKDGQWCAYSDIDDLAIEIDEMEAGDKAKIIVMDMTEEEYKNLPEFKGW